jgi:hypothetical protein
MASLKVRLQITLDSIFEPFPRHLETPKQQNFTFKFILPRIPLRLRLR